jgi:hypothetical protein
MFMAATVVKECFHAICQGHFCLSESGSISAGFSHARWSEKTARVMGLIILHWKVFFEAGVFGFLR